MENLNQKDLNLKSLSTIQKILLLQNYLKEMTSIKERFNDNKKKMIQKIDLNCYTYFKNKIYINKIFDFCMSHNPEENIENILITDSNDYLKEIYKPLYDFYFLIRNDNSLMLKIIELSDKYVYENLSDFFVNFLYENIIKSSFVNEELMLMIFLLLEKLILKTLPDKIDKNKNIPISILNNSFLFYAFKYLTRKIDLRNFLFTILNDFIVKIGSFTIPLSVDINIANRYVRIRERKIFLSFMNSRASLTEEEINRNKKKFKKINNKDNLFKKNTTGNMYLKRTKKIVLGQSIANLNKDDESGNEKANNGEHLMSIEEKLMQTQSLYEDSFSNKPKLSEEINYKKFEKRKTEKKNEAKDTKCIEKNIGLNIYKNKSDEKKEELKVSNLNIAKNKSDKIGNDIQNDLDENGQIKINIFFEDNSITIKKLKEILTHYEKNKEGKESINFAMKEYLNILIIQITSGEFDNIKNDNIKKDKKKDFNEGNEVNKKDEEIFSTSRIIDELKDVRNIKQSDSFIGLMRKIRLNHKVITKTIINIINKLKENLISLPYSLKCISKMIDILLNKKYNISSKNKLSNYQLFMFKIDFLIGNIVLPIIKKPEFNGIETNNVISEITSDNLKIVSNIFDKMITGNLFNKISDPYMTIFNKFIIDTMPQLFELVENIEKNFKLPDKIQNLINSYDKTNKSQININYDYFKENPEENINFQSICFSWRNIYVFLQIIDENKKIFIEENENNEQKLILQKFLENQNIYINYFSKGLKDKRKEYIYLTKYYYNDIFYNKIKSIIQNNFIHVIPKPNNDLITAFKKCIIEVLNYANSIQEESFYELTERKDEKTFKPKKYKKSKKKEKQINDKNNINRKLNLFNSLKTSLVKIALSNKEDDADFKNILFPQIRKNLNLEFNYNVDNDDAQLIIFCTNYINLYMRNVPEIYKKNNYSLLFDELIIEIKNNIEYFKTNAIFEYYKKFKESQKLNMMNSNYLTQIQNLEKLKCIEYLYNKLLLPIKFKIEKDFRDIVYNIEYQKDQSKINDNLNKNSIEVMDYLVSKDQFIKNMIDGFFDFHEYEEEYDNILEIEEQADVPKALNEYFEVMNKLVKKEKIAKRFSKDELDNIIYDLENYILTKMYDKLFPFEYTREDVIFYQKCKRLGFLKPENLISNKKIINEKLWDQATQFFDELDNKLTPLDKIKCISKAFGIIHNSISFTSGEDELGAEDVIRPLAYIIIKSKPKNIISNIKYCELYLNSELSKKQFGVILAQVCYVINFIKEMKYNDLIGVSEKKFGKDEEIENEVK